MTFYQQILSPSVSFEFSAGVRIVNGIKLTQDRLSRFDIEARSILALRSPHFQSAVCSETVEPRSQCYLPYKKLSSISFSLSSGETIGFAKYLPHPVTTIDQRGVITVDQDLSHRRTFCAGNFTSIVPSRNPILCTQKFLSCRIMNYYKSKVYSGEPSSNSGSTDINFIQQWGKNNNNEAQNDCIFVSL